MATTTTTKRTRTVGGKPVHPNMEHLIPDRHTDEGVEEFNEGKEFSRIEFGADPFDKALLQHAEAENQPWETTDPVSALIREYGKPGHRHHLLGPEITAREGTRGFTPIRDKDGRLVKLGQMVLSSMPEDVAKQRDKHYQKLAQENVTDTTEDFAVKQETMLSEIGARGRGLSPLSPGTRVNDSNTVAALASRGQAPERPPQSTDIGLHIGRGNPDDY